MICDQHWQQHLPNRVVESISQCSTRQLLNFAKVRRVLWISCKMAKQTSFDSHFIVESCTSKPFPTYKLRFPANKSRFPTNKLGFPTNKLGFATTKLGLSRNKSFSTALVQKQRLGPKWVFPSLRALPFGYTGSRRDVDEVSASEVWSY
jgi:hypothetical protein